jgi:hypothetical protein
MNLWFRLTLVCCVLVCLSMLLSLTQEVGLNQLLPIVASGPWLDVGREPASDAPTVSAVRSTEIDPARIGSLVPDCALSANSIGPPGQETHGPPELMGHCRVADQAGNLNQRHRATFPRHYWLSTAELKNRGVLQQPLAS